MASSYNETTKSEKIALNKIEAAVSGIRKYNRYGYNHPGPEWAKKVPVANTGARRREVFHTAPPSSEGASQQRGEDIQTIPIWEHERVPQDALARTIYQSFTVRPCHVKGTGVGECRTCGENLKISNKCVVVETTKIIKLTD